MSANNGQRPRNTTADPADEAWKRQYVAEFVRYALTRNWTNENATVWAGEIADDALTYGGTDPAGQAQVDDR